MTHEQMISVLVQQQAITEEQRDTLSDLNVLTADKSSASRASIAEPFGLHEIDLLSDASPTTCDAPPSGSTSPRPRTTRRALRICRPVTLGTTSCCRWRSKTEGRVLCCTTEETLPTAVAFLLRSVEVPFRIVIADVRPLEQYIAEQYHYEGIDAA